MVRHLLANGADPLIKDKTGRDALGIAQHLKRDGIIKVFQEEKERKLTKPLQEEKERKTKLHSKVEMKLCGLKEQYYDSALKTKQKDVPIHKLATLLCNEKLVERSLDKYDEVCHHPFIL